jgi:hypothetical protein
MAPPASFANLLARPRYRRNASFETPAIPAPQDEVLS